jgi:hypothetical protein
MSAKPKPAPTLAEYQGQASRLCDLLGITPAPDTLGGVPKTILEFEALAAWCQREQLYKNKSKKDGYEGF